ncbi:pyrroline-5-carboxylate reductase [Undibacterium crateris]|uniref:pyrroline-5-carboxylate reductase n=1 Tax=Undibacterium crateris TaxID=2528175 RepID=UPI001389C9AC|nr:pyrroline-5-carboxylate reductase [Undibacterium crateris]NDI86143.1 pyrroline-5-carboxylate reductase [Undibacterium crateris]
MQNKTNHPKLKIAFIGGGNMAAALMGGLIPAVAAASDVHVVDVSQLSLTRLEAEYGVSTALQIDQGVAAADVIVLAVKPQQMRDVIQSLQPFLTKQLLISIAAGIRASDMSRWLGDYQHIVRSMPNTPAMVGKGITGLYALPGVTADQKQIAETILSAVGMTSWFEDEAKIDAVTAISGSGPAYVFYFIEALQQAALELGFSPAQASQFAIATFEGAASLALHADEPVATLREKVTSKGGTTFAALSSMQEAGIQAAIVRAAKAAAQRATELGDEFGQQA